MLSCMKKAKTPFTWPAKVITKASAPAKINLTLHVTGQQSDGYHLLDSLVVFAGVSDQLTATLAPDISLTVSGPFAAGVPSDSTNLVMKAARALQAARSVKKGAAITLEKNLPHAAGIGGGSSDAAATLAMLSKLWGVPPLKATAPEVLALGADVPVCMRALSPIRMSGIGDVLSPVPALPRCALVLARPPVDVPTAAVFKKLKAKDGAPMTRFPTRPDFDAFVGWLNANRNDLRVPAGKVAPEIEATIKKLESFPTVAAAGMSGSGATCFGLVKDMAAARQIARVVQVSEMSWWVAPAEVLSSNS